MIEDQAGNSDGGGVAADGRTRGCLRRVGVMRRASSSPKRRGPRSTATSRFPRGRALNSRFPGRRSLISCLRSARATSPSR